MDISLKQLAADLKAEKNDAYFKESVWQDRIHIGLADYYIEIKKDFRYFFIEYKLIGKDDSYLSAKIRIMHKSNQDILELKKLIKLFSEYNPFANGLYYAPQ